MKEKTALSWPNWISTFLMIREFSNLIDSFWREHNKGSNGRTPPILSKAGLYNFYRYISYIVRQISWILLLQTILKAISLEFRRNYRYSLGAIKCCEKPKFRAIFHYYYSSKEIFSQCKRNVLFLLIKQRKDNDWSEFKWSIPKL